MGNSFLAISIIGIALSLLPVGYFLWLLTLYRLPPAVGGTVVTEFEPPEEIGPAEAVFLLDGSLKPRALAAMLVDLHLRGFVEIEHAGDSVTGFTRVAKEGRMASHEKIFLRMLFGETGHASVKEAAARIKEGSALLKTAIAGSLREKKIFADKSLALPIIAASAVVSALMVQLSLIPLIGFFNAVVVMLVLILFSQGAYIASTWRPPLTDRGRRLYWQLQGFRTYLRTAEAERIRWQEKERGAMDRFLPYAIVFDVTLTWATRLQPVTNAFLETFDDKEK